MKNDPTRKTTKKTNSRKWKAQWKKIVSTLAAVTVFCTTYALILPAITVNSNTYCGLEEHEHTEACYTKELICGFEESEAQGESGETAPETVTETVTEIVTETVIEKEIQQVLVDEGHVHQDSCYEETRNLVCGLEEKEEVLDEEGNVVEEGHTHTDECYQVERVLVCGQEEREPVYEEQEVEVEKEVQKEVEVPVEQPAQPEQPAGEPHVHTDACYKEVLTCGKEEHKHVDECFSNPTLDLETAADWEKTLPKEDELTENWAEDVLTIAKSQLGYKESSRNFKAVNGDRKGYTRYGARFGAPYSDWCAMFIQFAMHYAGVDERLMPGDPSVSKWIENVKKIENYFEPADYTPVPGDIMFIDWDKVVEGVERDGDHIGIVAEVKTTEETTSDGAKLEVPTAIVTIEGNLDNEVKYNTYKIDDERILGYSHMPEKPETEEELEERVEEIESQIDGNEPVEGEEGAEGEEPAEGTEEEKEEKEVDTIIALASYTESGVQVNFEAPASVFPEGAVDPALNVVEILPGTPEYDEYFAQAQANTEAGTEVLNARFFDISVVDPEGNEIKLNDESLAKVEIIFPKEDTDTIEAKSDVNVLHFVEEGTEVLGSETQGITTVEGVSFETPGFSVFGVVSTTAVTTKYISDSGAIYEVTVTYGPEANLPEDAALSITEYAEDSEEYQKIVSMLEQSDDIYNDVIDISIVDSEGNKLEPAAPVTVDLVVLQPELDTLVYSAEPTITHIKEDGDTTTPEVMEIVATETQELSDGTEVTKAVSFEVDGFSTFALSWGSSDENSKTRTRIFYGYERDTMFMEFPQNTGRPNNGPTGSTFNLTAAYAGVAPYGTSGTPTIYYVSPRGVSGMFRDSDHVPSRVGIPIGTELRQSGNQWQFYATGNWVDYSSGKGVNRGPGWYNIASGSEIYVKYPYDPRFNVSIEDPNKRGGDEYVPLSSQEGEADDLGEPLHEKTKTSNGDGTYTLALNVTGKEASGKASTKADIILIYDTSGSTGNFDQYKIDGKYRWQIIKPAVDNLIDSLMSNNDIVEDSVRMGLIRFADHGEIHFTIEDNPTAEQMKANIPTYGSGRTNWEDAWLKLAQIKTRVDAKQYVVFITDGDPTLRNTAIPFNYREYALQKEGGGNHIEVQGWKVAQMRKVYSTGNHNGFYFIDDNNVIGGGKGVKYNVPHQWDETGISTTQPDGRGPYGYSVEGSYEIQMNNNAYAASDTVATAGNGSGNVTNIGIGAFLTGNSKTRLSDLMTHVNGETHFAYNYDDFMSIFTPLIEEISTQVRYEDVKITDGITKHAAHLLQDGSSNNFQYYRYGGKYGDPWAIAGDAYAGKSFQELPANVKGRFAWTDAPRAVYRATNTAEESGKVEWDLSSIQVEGGVTYEVAFQVWPDQFSYDTASDTLNNLPASSVTGAHPYDSLSQADKNQINRDGNNFSVETNTDAKVDYKEVKTHGGNTTTKEGTAEYNRVDDMPLDVMEIPIKKEWFNDENTQYWKELYESEGRSIDFEFKENGVTQKTLTLNGANNWTTSVYVSPGLMVRDSYIIKNGNTTVYEVKYNNNKAVYNISTGGTGSYYEINNGHQYTFAELSNTTDFTFTPKVYNAKLVYPSVNDTPKTMIDASTGGRWTILAGNPTEYVLGVNKSTVVPRGELAVNKKVFDAQGTEVSSTDTFAVKVALVDSEGNGYTGLTYVIMENNQPVMGDVDGHPSVTNSTTGERPITSNTKDGHVFDIKTTQTVVIKGIPNGATYTVSENDVPGYLLIGYVNNGTNVTTNRNTGAGMSVNGQIGTGRVNVTVKNEARVSLQITKTVSNLAGKPIDSEQVFWVNAKITNARGQGYNYNGNNSAGGGITYNIYDAEGNKITDPIEGHAPVLEGEDFRRPGPISGSGGLTNTLRFPIKTGWTIVFNGIPTNAQWEVSEDLGNMGGYRIESYSVNGVPTKVETLSTGVRPSKVSGDFTSTISSGGTTSQAVWQGPYTNFDNNGVYLIYSQAYNSYLGVDASGNLTLVPEKTSGPTYREMFASYNNGAIQITNTELKRVAWQTQSVAGGTTLKNVATGKWIQYSYGSWYGDYAQLTMGDNYSSSYTMVWKASNGNLGGKIYGTSDTRTYYVDMYNNRLGLSACSSMPFSFYKLQNAVVASSEHVSVNINNEEKPTTLEISKSLESFRNDGQDLAYGDEQLFWFEVSITHNGGGLSTADDGITYDLLEFDGFHLYSEVEGDVTDSEGNLIHGSVITSGGSGAYDNSFRDVEQLCRNAGHTKTDLMRIPLKAGQKVVFQGIPEGATWTIKEVNIDPKYSIEGFKVDDGELGEENSESGTTSENTVVEAINKEVPTSIELKKNVLGVDGTIDNTMTEDVFWFDGYIKHEGSGLTYDGHSVYYYLIDRDGNVYTENIDGHQNVSVSDEDGVRGRKVTNTSNIALPLKAGWTIKFVNVPIGSEWKFKERTSAMPQEYRLNEYTVGDVHRDEDNQGYISDTVGKNTTYIIAENQIQQSELVVGKLLYDYKHSRIFDEETWFTVKVKALDARGNGLAKYDATNNPLRTYTVYVNGLPYYGDLKPQHADVINQETGERPINGNMGGEGAGFAIKQGMYIKLNNMPVGGTWEVTESNLPSGYSLEGYTRPSSPLEATNKNHVDAASGTFQAGTQYVDVHNKKDLPEIVLEKVDNRSSEIKLGGAEFRLIDERFIGLTDIAAVNIFETNLALGDWDGEKATGGVVNPNVGGKWGYGATKIGPDGFAKQLAGNVQAGDNNGADLLLRTDGYLTRKSTGELLKNKNGNIIRYLPITVTTEEGSGRVSLGQLAPGTYYLEEISAPDGYNLPEGWIRIKVENDYSITVYELSGKSTTADIAKPLTVQNEQGKYVFVADNRSGEALPETGGIGTTILYIAGAILVIGAGVLLIVRKKMNK